jgi:hypothetical protein
MEIPQADALLRSGQSTKAGDLRLQNRLEDCLNELKAEVTERPFLSVALAFAAGLVSHTFPARILFYILMRVASWLVGPAILLLGIFKLNDFFSSSQPNEPMVREGQ